MERGAESALPARPGRWRSFPPPGAPAALALLATAAGLVPACHHPLAPLGLGAAFLAWAALCWRWPALWLALLPAVLPLAGWAPWTGWLSFEEFDLVVLGAAAGGYGAMARRGERLAPPPAAFRLPPWARLGLVLFALSLALGLYRGFADAGGFRFGWFQGYYEPMNSLRLGKPFFLALLLLPLLQKEMRARPQRAPRLLAAGLVAGLVVAALAAVWERAAFTGLLDFSADYRTTALFWEMHVGGAALDGFLVLALPFACRLAAGAGTTAARLAGALALLLAAYACFTTFSRGLYLAAFLALAAMAALLLRRRERSAPSLGIGVAGFMAAWALAAWLAFRHGGYRALAAAAAVAGIGLPLAWRLRQAAGRGWAPGVVAGLALGGAHVFLAAAVPKGPYVLFALAVAANGAGLYWQQRRAGRGGAVLVAGYVWLALAAAAVAFHWGGPPALQDGAAALAILLLAGAWTARSPFPLWPRDAAGQGGIFLALLLVGGATAVFAGGAYMGQRFATSAEDLAQRWRQWGAGLALLDGGSQWLAGRGLGRYPAAFFYSAPGNAFPGSYRLAEEGGNAYLVLFGPRHDLGYGQLFRLGQRLPVVPGLYRATLKVRVREAAFLHLEICEKHLLYPGGCAERQVRVAAGGWQTLALWLDGRELGGGSGRVPRLAFFSLALESGGATMDIDDVGLVGPDGRELLANGGFSQETARWFFTSDRYHLPWHIDSLYAHLLFEQGLIGLAVFVALALAALGRLAVGAGRGDPFSPFLAAALLGFLAVGAFATLLDAPRVAFLYYLLLLWSLLASPAAPEERRRPDGRPGNRSAEPGSAASAGPAAAPGRQAHEAQAQEGKGAGLGDAVVAATAPAAIGIAREVCFAEARTILKRNMGDIVGAKNKSGGQAAQRENDAIFDESSTTRYSAIAGSRVIASGKKSVLNAVDRRGRL